MSHLVRSGLRRLADLPFGPSVRFKMFRMIRSSLRRSADLLFGSVSFEIAALVEKIPGEAAVAAFVGPRVFIPLERIEETKLVQKGSRVTYEKFYKLDNAEQIATNLKEKAATDRVRIQTVEGRKRSLGRALDNLYSFLNLVGFIALLMGAVGVGSSVQVYARQKKTTIAILRCLGVSSTQALSIFIIQIINFFIYFFS